MITNEKQQPPESPWVWTWERAKDPFHADAFPDALKEFGNSGERVEGWLGLDKYQNPVTFIKDGSEFIEK